MTTLLAWMTAAAILGGAAEQERPGWVEQIRPGEPLLIWTAAGERIEGAAERVVRTGIGVRTRAGLKTVDFQRILRVQRRDSVRNGILIGAGVGAAVASLPLVIGNECRYETCGSQLGFPIAGATLGAAIGWGIDGAIKGWTTIFAVAPRASVTPRKGSVILRAAFVW